MREDMCSEVIGIGHLEMVTYLKDFVLVQMKSKEKRNLSNYHR